MSFKSLIHTTMILAGLFAWSNVVSQEGSSEKVDAFFRITHGYNSGDTIFPIIDGGSRIGIRAGMNVSAFNTYNPKNQKQKRRSEYIGYGRVVRVFPDSSVCQINLVQGGSELDSIAAGDIVGVKIPKPANGDPSIFFELALLNIFFTDLEDDKYYTLDLLLNFDFDFSVLDSLLYSKFLDEFSSTYENFKNDIPELMKEPVKRDNRYKGKVAFDLLKDIEVSDLESFIQFVRRYPMNYAGKDQKFVIAFLNWALYDGNYTLLEMYGKLYPIHNDAVKLNNEISKYRVSLIEDRVIGVYADSMQEYHSSKNYKRVDQLRSYAWALANALNDIAGKGEIMLALADIKMYEYEFNSALKYCDSSIYYGRQCSAFELEMKAYLKRVQILVNDQKFEDAKSSLKEMENRLNTYEGRADRVSWEYYNQNKIQFEGWVYYMSGDYGNAISKYTVAADLNNRIFSKNSRSNNAMIYENLGLIYKAQGKNNDAIRSFSAAAAIYDSLNEVSEKAQILNKLGEVYYNSGNYREAVHWFDNAADLNRRMGNQYGLGYSLTMKGNSYSMEGKVDSAIILYHLAIDTKRNLLGVAYSWSQLGQLYQVKGSKSKALEAFDSARVIFEKLKDSGNLRDNYVNVGVVYHKDENYKKAIGYYEKAMTSSSKVSTDALYNVAIALLDIDQDKSYYYLNKVEKAYDSLKNYDQQFNTLMQLTGVSYRRSDYTNGDQYLNKMKALIPEIGTPARNAAIGQMQAYRFIRTGSLDSALMEFDRAYSIFDTVNKDEAISVMLLKSDVLVSLGEFEKAKAIINQALSASKLTRSPLRTGLNYLQLSILCNELGALETGLKYVDSAAMIFRNSGNNIRYAGCLISRGLICKDKGEYKKALESILYADSVYQAEGTERYRVSSLNGASLVYLQQGDYRKAVEYLRQAAGFYFTDSLSEGYLGNRVNLAECYYQQKSYDEVIGILEKNYPIALRRNYRMIAMAMANILGNVYFEMGDLAKSRSYKQQAFDLSVSSGSAEEMMDAITGLGRIDRQQGNNVSADTMLRRSLSIGKASGLNNELWKVYYELGILFYLQKKYDSAIVYFRSAVDIVEQLAGNIYGGEEARKLYSSDPRKVDLYNKIIASFVAVKDPAKASEYALRNSITALNSKYGKDLGFADSTLKADLAKAEDIQRQIHAVNANIAKADTKEKKEALIQTRRILEEGYQNFMDERKEKYRDFDRYLKGGVNPEDLSNYKGGLPEDMAVISYIINDSLLYKFVVTNSTLEIVTTTLSEDINVQVNEFISALTSPDSGSGTGSLKVRAEFADKKKTSKKSFTEISESLYNILISDLLPVIGDKKKLCIIPSGKLSNIPFQCLGKRGPEGFRFLLEDYRVFYANRLDMFRSKDASDRNISNMAAFGNPDKSLEFAKQEVLDIQKVSHAKMVYVEEGATEVKARQSLVQNKYVHFATHGTLDYVKPKQSYLTFTVTPGAGDDGRLTIAEIDSMKTGSQYAELVTLSACETARPLAISEDWYVSPANSFLRKKFKTVVASLWKVNDEATGLLMSTFYRNLENMDKVDALRQAQETVSGDPRYKHPYYWGGFVLYGDWR